MFQKLSVLLTLTIYIFIGCTSPVKKTSPIIEKDNKNQVDSKTISEPLPKEDNCQKYPSPEIDIPYYVPRSGFIITRVAETCTTNSGKKGFTKKATSWTAMGFPCTGSSGVVDIKGKHYTNPKMVSFHISNSCPMYPSDLSYISDTGIKALGMNPQSKLLAYYPFALQYWELLGSNEADTGDVVELRSLDSRKKLWQKLRLQEKLTLFFYGKENSWIKDRKMYFAKVELFLTGQRSFKINLLETKSLTLNEILAVKKRCESLKPKRNCSSVFSSYKAEKKPSH